MNRTSIRTAAVPAVAALALGLSLSACGAANEQDSAKASSGSKLSGTLNGAGSSAQEAAQGAWTSGFQSANSGATVNYDPVGSSGGREQFLAGGVDFAGSDSPLSDDELASSKKVCHGRTALEVPAYISPVALVYHLDGVDKLQLSARTTADIFTGTVTKWNDPEVKADNPGVTLPGTRIVPVHRSDGSGTTDNLTQWLSKVGEGAWTSEPGGDWPLKGGEGAEGTSGVIDAVKNGKGTIGYADNSQAGDLTVAPIKVGSEYVAPSPDGATAVVDLSKRMSGRASDDMAIDIDRTTTESGTYPLTLASYVIACPTYTDAKKAALVKGYLTYLLSSPGQQAAAKTAGSAPLPDQLSNDAGKIADAIAAK